MGWGSKSWYVSSAKDSLVAHYGSGHKALMSPIKEFGV